MPGKEFAKLGLKSSSMSGAVPDINFLDYGEIAINFADGKIFYKNVSDEIKSIGESTVIDLSDYVKSINLPDLSKYLLITNLPDLSNFVTSNTTQTLSGLKTFSSPIQVKSVACNVITLNDGNIMWDGSEGNMAEVLLTQDSLLKNIDPVPNGTYLLKVKQDDIGGHTLNFGTKYKTVNGEVLEILDDPDAISILTIVKGISPDLYLLGQTNFMIIPGSSDDDLNVIIIGDDNPFEGIPSYRIIDDNTPSSITDMYNVPTLDYSWYGTIPIPEGSLYKGLNPWKEVNHKDFVYMAPYADDIENPNRWVIGWEDTDHKLFTGYYSNSDENPTSTYQTWGVPPIFITVEEIESSSVNPEFIMYDTTNALDVLFSPFDNSTLAYKWLDQSQPVPNGDIFIGENPYSNNVSFPNIFLLQIGYAWWGIGYLEEPNLIIPLYKTNYASGPEEYYINVYSFNEEEPISDLANSVEVSSISGPS